MEKEIFICECCEKQFESMENGGYTDDTCNCPEAYENSWLCDNCWKKLGLKFG